MFLIFIKFLYYIFYRQLHDSFHDLDTFDQVFVFLLSILFSCFRFRSETDNRLPGCWGSFQKWFHIYDNKHGTMQHTTFKGIGLVRFSNNTDQGIVLCQNRVNISKVMLTQDMFQDMFLNIIIITWMVNL